MGNEKFSIKKNHVLLSSCLKKKKKYYENEFWFY